MKWQHNIFTMPANFRPTSDTITGIRFDPYKTRAILITSCGEVFLDPGGLPEGVTAKTVACLAAINILGQSKELEQFLWAIELPPVPVEPTSSGSWLVYIKYTKIPVRLCESEEQAIKWMDQSSLLGVVFWNHGESWFNVKERINRGS